MLSSPLMMDHVRSYYQEKSLNIPHLTELKSQPLKLVKGKYIWRTRTRRKGAPKKKMKLIKPLTRKRNSDEFKPVQGTVKNLNASSKLKLVLTKEHQNNEGVGKFSLKRVSQIFHGPLKMKC